MPPMIEATRRIIEEILALPAGKVSCYRDIALRAGLPNGARQVARALHSLSQKYGLPWYRIVRADGCIAMESGPEREQQIALLRGEGVEVSAGGWIDLKKYGP